MDEEDAVFTGDGRKHKNARRNPSPVITAILSIHMNANPVSMTTHNTVHHPVEDE